MHYDHCSMLLSSSMVKFYRDFDRSLTNSLKLLMDHIWYPGLFLFSSVLLCDMVPNNYDQSLKSTR